MVKVWRGSADGVSPRLWSWARVFVQDSRQESAIGHRPQSRGLREPRAVPRPGRAYELGPRVCRPQALSPDSHPTMKQCFSGALKMTSAFTCNGNCDASACSAARESARPYDVFQVVSSRPSFAQHQLPPRGCLLSRELFRRYKGKRERDPRTTIAYQSCRDLAYRLPVRSLSRPVLRPYAPL